MGFATAEGVPSFPDIAKDTLRGRDMLCFGHDWTGDPLSKTHLMRLLARDNRILWINSIGYRAPTASTPDLSRAINKLKVGDRAGQRGRAQHLRAQPAGDPGLRHALGAARQPRAAPLPGAAGDARASASRGRSTGSSTPPPPSSPARSARSWSSTTASTSTPPSPASAAAAGRDRGRARAARADLVIVSAERLFETKVRQEPAHRPGPARRRLRPLPQGARPRDRGPGRDREPAPADHRLLRPDGGGLDRHRPDGPRRQALLPGVARPARQGDHRHLAADRAAQRPPARAQAVRDAARLLQGLRRRAQPVPDQRGDAQRQPAQGARVPRRGPAGRLDAHPRGRGAGPVPDRRRRRRVRPRDRGGAVRARARAPRGASRCASESWEGRVEDLRRHVAALGAKRR